MSERPKVLLVGESWMNLGAHVKGFNEFLTGFYEEGHAPLTAALEEGFEVEHLPAHLAATQFPDDVNQLSEYKVILFSDIGADTLLLHPNTFLHYQPRPNRLKVIREYVAEGGGFGMIGGYMSFSGFGGRAHYSGTAVEDILPVTILPYDDRVEVPEGFAPTVVDATHPILVNVEGEWPILLGYNRLQKRDGSTVLLEHEHDPILAIRQYGQGRTLAFASDCAPHWGSEQFTEWQSYSVFWLRAVEWMAGLI